MCLFVRSLIVSEGLTSSDSVSAEEVRSAGLASGRENSNAGLPFLCSSPLTQAAPEKRANDGEERRREGQDGEARGERCGERVTDCEISKAISLRR